MTWLPLYGLFYAAVTLYWARVAAAENRNVETYFSAGHNVAPWISALVIAGASLSGWALLDGAARIGSAGFGLPALLQAGIALALPGVFFFKRLWLIGQRLRLSSLNEVLRAYYGSEFLVVFATVVAVLFAVAFAGLQLAALSRLVVLLTAGEVSMPVAATLLSLVLFGYVVIGGMRAVGYLGAVQAVLAATAIAGFAGFSLISLGGFGALNSGLAALAADPAKAGAFIVSGVVQFTAGAGREAAALHDGTAVASLSVAFALMGFQASPLAIKMVLSTRSPRGIAAGQTWVMAGAFGGLIALCIACIGAAALVNPGLGVSGLLASLSPWFGAWLFIGLLAGVQLMAGLALPLAFQLWTPLLGITWLRWITRPAAVTGVGFGIAGVLLTEPFGIAVLSFFGLDLPWGRAPWTIHSAAWGMAANLTVTLLVSAFTQRRGFGEQALEARRFLLETVRSRPRVMALRSTAWSIALAWFFLAVGPGLIFGNYAFLGPDGSWPLGMPSLWGWGLMFWVAGLGLVWFLSYKMEMASPL
ncbi:MAG: hypothetical protein BGN83_01615, partial [Rhizobium sp. 63-7]